MLIITNIRNLFKTLIFLLFIFSLCGCNYISQQYRNMMNHPLQGEILSPSEIPENSVVTISLSSVGALNLVENNISNYQIKIEERGKTINFVLYLDDEVINTPKPLGLSVRIEKNGELLMMSKNIVTLPQNLSEKISIPVITIH
ncbi:TPA: YbaY family lipoprotein [Providencia rettgeri]|uniref:YbaY family lipoprotein n=1 Tax=Providencia sp. PROV129 TaxID=2949839 RepID=UPI002349FFB0|nr:YbaY family lipoprotein [Providencia rettgeri]